MTEAVREPRTLNSACIFLEYVLYVCSMFYTGINIENDVLLFLFINALNFFF